MTDYFTHVERRYWPVVPVSADVIEYTPTELPSGNNYIVEEGDMTDDFRARYDRAFK